MSAETRLQLFEKHAPWARRIARAVARRLPSWIELDDLAQVAATEHWKQTGLYQPERGVPYQGFAVMAVRGACFMLIRRRQFTESNMQPLTEDMRGPVKQRPDVQGEHSENMRRVRFVLANLPAAQRRVLEMHYLDGVPLTECARQMHQKPAAVYALKERAVAEMRRRLRKVSGAEATDQPNLTDPGWTIMLDGLTEDYPELARVRRHRKPNADEAVGDWGEDARRGQDA